MVLCLQQPLGRGSGASWDLGLGWQYWARLSNRTTCECANAVVKNRQRALVNESVLVLVHKYRRARVAF